MTEETKKWLKFVQASSVPLAKVDETGNPTGGIASGSLIEYAGNRFLFSVFHATRISDRWLIRLRYDPTHNRTDVFFAPRFNYFIETSPNAPFQGVKFDLSFIQVSPDVVPYFQHLQPSGLVEERERPIFASDLSEQPQKNIPYAFAGEVRPSFVPDHDTLTVEHSTYPGLTFNRTEGVYHYFRLPIDHPGHEAFEGCSGAPIVGFDRRVVALVAEGDIEANEIIGISMSAFKTAIDKFLSIEA
jgi:hypothetical protein